MVRGNQKGVCSTNDDHNITLKEMNCSAKSFLTFPPHKSDTAVTTWSQIHE